MRCPESRRRDCFQNECNADNGLYGQTLIKINENFISQRLVYQHNDLDQIIYQSVLLVESIPEDRRWLTTSSIRTGSRKTTSIKVSSTERIHYEFIYDERERLATAGIFNNDKFVWEETYIYEGTLTWPFRVNRFVLAAPISNIFYSNYKSEWYNEHGDPIKSENYDDDQNLIRTRYYEYVYNDQNNWIKCDMFLEGGVEKTEQPTMILNRAIKYYL